jgi:hypothetical protein
LGKKVLRKRVVEGKLKEGGGGFGIEVTGRRGRKLRNLLDTLKKGEYNHV